MLKDHTFKLNTNRSESDSEAEDPDKGRNYEVTAYFAQGLYYCQCCKFERGGILCCHILWVMDVYGIKEVPSRYILKRWTWDAEEALGPHGMQELHPTQQEMPARAMSVLRNSVTEKNFTEIADEACYCDEMSKVVDIRTKEMQRALAAIWDMKALRRRCTDSQEGALPQVRVQAQAILQKTQTWGQVRLQRTSETRPHQPQKGRPREQRYKSELDIQVKHKKKGRKSVHGV